MSADRIYVVSDGEYSDYSVLFACPDEATAEAAAAAVRGMEHSWHRNAFVESLPMFDAPPKSVPVFRGRAGVWRATGKRFSCTIGFGDALPSWDDVIQLYYGEWEPEASCPAAKHRRFCAEAWPNALCVEVAGRDREAVAKTLTDQMAQAVDAVDRGVTEKQWAA